MKNLLLLFALLPGTTFAAFNDLNLNHPYYEAINYLQSQNIMEGSFEVQVFGTKQ